MFSETKYLYDGLLYKFDGNFGYEPVCMIESYIIGFQNVLYYKQLNMNCNKDLINGIQSSGFFIIHGIFLLQ